jgi:hypothetical protein
MFMETLVYGIQRPQPAQTNVLVNTTALSARVNYFTHFLLSWSAYVSTTSIPYRFRTDVSDVACYYFHPQWHVDGCGDYDFSNLEGNGK